MTKGTIVKMSDEFKRNMNLVEDNREHIKEFGDCVGVVEDRVFPELDEAEEVNVRWQPSNLRYAYFLTDLTAL